VDRLSGTGSGSNFSANYLGTIENLTLYDRDSLMMRGAVLLDSSNRPRACTSILPVSGMMTAQAVFRSTVVGRIWFRQNPLDPQGELHLVTDLRFAESNAATPDHKWHVHVSSAGLDQVKGASNICASTGGHYNPTTVPASASDYATKCRADFNDCEAGTCVFCCGCSQTLTFSF
jgi:hypothetical protein